MPTKEEVWIDLLWTVIYDLERNIIVLRRLLKDISKENVKRHG